MLDENSKISNKKTTLFIVFIVGIILPHIPYLVIIEMFYLLRLLSFIFIFFAICLVVSFFDKKTNTRNAIFLSFLIPLFISSQILSGIIVDKLQRFRSKNAIEEIERIKSETDSYPEKYDLSFGIEYNKGMEGDEFTVKYSRGFMVTEVYSSKSKVWVNYGWND